MTEATSFAKDVDLLAKLGYKQEFKRDFKPLELFGLGFSIVGVLPSIAYVIIFLLFSERLSEHGFRSVMFYSVPYGGPVSMVWGVSSPLWLLICPPNAVIQVGSLQYLPRIYRIGNGRVRILCSDIWRGVLLDLQVLFPEV
jgi:hypothetical protein